MRFLLFNQFYPPDFAPTGRVLHDLAQVLVSRGHEVHAICSQEAYTDGRRFPRRSRLDGVEIHRYPGVSVGRRMTLIQMVNYILYGLYSAVHALLGMPRADVVVSLTTPPYLGLLTQMVARRHSATHVLWIMDVYPDVLAAHGALRREGLVFRMLEKVSEFQNAGSQLIISLGPYMASKTVRRVHAKQLTEWVPLWGNTVLSGSTEESVARMRRDRGWTEHDLVLLYSGNIGRGHRFQEFLDAAERFRGAGPRWVFIGGGQRRGEIEEFVRRCPEALVELHAYVPERELGASLRSADVHLVSLQSSWQGLIVPSKLQTIFSTGKPTIFVGGRNNEVAEWIQDSGGGWLVPEGDTDALMDAVEQARDPSERRSRGHAAYVYSERHFRRDLNCERISRMIEHVRKEPHRNKH